MDVDMKNADRVREILALADQMKVEELIEYFAEDAVMELPFAPGRMPKRYEGKDAILGFQVFARDSYSSFSMTVDAIHETADPNVVIAEHHSDGVVAANGRRYENRYCTIFAFDDAGRVVRWREYYDAGVVVRAFRP
jgi:ketosteroid isomerase-like protein